MTAMLVLQLNLPLPGPIARRPSPVNDRATGQQGALILPQKSSSSDVPFLVEDQ